MARIGLRGQPSGQRQRPSPAIVELIEKTPDHGRNGRWKASGQGFLEVMPCLVIALSREVCSREFETYAGKIGAAFEDGLETPCRHARQAEAHLDTPEHEETRDRLFVIGGTCLFDEGVSVLRSTGLQEKPAELQIAQT